GRRPFLIHCADVANLAGRAVPAVRDRGLDFGSASSDVDTPKGHGGQWGIDWEQPSHVSTLLPHLALAHVTAVDSHEATHSQACRAVVALLGRWRASFEPRFSHHLPEAAAATNCPILPRGKVPPRHYSDSSGSAGASCLQFKSRSR